MEHADVRLSVRRQSRLQRRPGTSVDILGTRTCRVLRTPKGPGTDSRSGIAKHAHGRFWRIVLKNSKIAGLRKSRNVACGRIQPRQGSVKSIRAPASVFAVTDVVPRIEASETHQGL